MIEGRATVAATKAWSEQSGTLRPDFRVLGRTGLSVSAVGFGSYRVHPSVDRHRQALRSALRSGVNLIDTSSNYGDGGAEILIGQELQELFASGEATREQIVVVSKVGYIQGQNLAIAQSRESSGRPYADVVKYSDDCWHCLHPEFIEDQLALSLSRLQLKTLDVLLLHNPEYYFMAELKAAGSKADIAKMQADFYDRIRRAFVCLEDLVDQGVIGSYGVSSNSFILPTRNLDATNLAVMLDLAEQIASQMRGSRQAHHFSVVQMPANLGERGAFEEANCNGLSPTAFAGQNQLGVLFNRPLNCIQGRQLIRLAEVVGQNESAPLWPDAVENMSQALHAVDSWLKTLDVSLQEQFGSMEESMSELRAIDVDQVDLDSWRFWTEHRLLRGFATWEKAVRSRLDEPSVQSFDRLWQNLWSALLILVQAGDLSIRRKMRASAQQIALSCPGWTEAKIAEKPLQQLAVAQLLQNKDTSSILVGMRRPGYVVDAIHASRL